MPYKIVKNADGSYEVKNAKTGKVHAKHTDLTKAEAQIRIMESAENGKKSPVSKNYSHRR
jgi:hypothetical protein